MKKTEKVVCAVTVEVIGPADATVKRIRFVMDILRNSIKNLDKQFKKSRFPQMKGFSLRPRKS